MDKTEAVAKGVSVWSYLPAFDGQTLFTFIVGTIISLATFWFAYKKTIGASEERLRAVNQELIASVLRRVAVEREVMLSEQFEKLQKAKAYKNSVAVSRLIDFESVLSIVLEATIDNDFLDAVSKKAIIDLLNESEASKSANGDPRDDTKESDRQKKFAATVGLAILSTVVGWAISVIYVLVIDDKNVMVWDSGVMRDNTKKVLVLSIGLMAILVAMFSWIVATRPHMIRKPPVRERRSLEGVDSPN